MLVVDGDTVWPTPDELAGAAVTARVVGEAKGPKIIGFTYKNKTNSTSGGATASTTPPSRSPASTGAREAEMSKTKGGGSTRNGRDSAAQRLGVKVYDGGVVSPGRSSSASGAPTSTPASRSAGAATTPCSPWPTAR